MAFIPNPKCLPEVNHKNYDRTDSSVENLEWISHADNVRYSKINMPSHKGKNNPNYGNRKLSQKYSKDKKYSLEKQSRPGIKNGRCRKIMFVSPSGEKKEFEFVGECAQYLIDNGMTNTTSINSVRGQIISSIRNNKYYLNHFFSYI